jgi:hypothetical protein
MHDLFRGRAGGYLLKGIKREKSNSNETYPLTVDVASSSNSSLGVLAPFQKKTQLMKHMEKNKLLRWNTILWLMAMVLPAVFSIAFASTKFPWPIILPLLLLGPMLLSNKMLAEAVGESTVAPQAK